MIEGMVCVLKLHATMCIESDYRIANFLTMFAGTCLFPFTENSI